MTQGSSNASYVPRGWPTVIPRIVVPDTRALVEFVKAVFGATGDYHAERPTELRIGDSMLMISSLGERDAIPAFLYVYVEDVDAVHRKAIEAGATEIEPPVDTPYGDRRAMARDTWGNTWQIATHSGRFTP